jgi:ATP-dependent RNA helicase RhlE
MAPEIQVLADNILNNPVKVEITPISTTAEKIEQHIYFVEKGQKRALLQHLLEQEHLNRVLVFTRTKHGADKIVKELKRAHIEADAIHGNKAQNARQRALANFKNGNIPVLVATDIAARGIDIDDISHVINYDLPNVPETYVHRIGRTGRAGTSGTALSFCDTEERAYLKDIQKLIRMQIPVVEKHPYPSDVPFAADRSAAPPRPKTKSRGGQASGRSGYWRNKSHTEKSNNPR